VEDSAGGGEAIEPAKERGWIAGVWGIVLFIILLGPIFGFFLWWAWTRSPLRAWVNLLITLGVIGLLIVIL
jgi:hypothetical protein